MPPQSPNPGVVARLLFVHLHILLPSLYYVLNNAISYYVIIAQVVKWRHHKGEVRGSIPKNTKNTKIVIFVQRTVGSCFLPLDIKKLPLFCLIFA